MEEVEVKMAVKVVAVAARHLHGGVRRFRRPRGEVVAEEGGEEEAVVRVEEQPVVRARLRVGGGGGEEPLVVEDERKVQRLLGVFAALGSLGVEELRGDGGGGGEVVEEVRWRRQWWWKRRVTCAVARSNC